jgi:hypothetical protein
MLRTHIFLLSTYEIWKVLVSLEKKIIAYFHVLRLFINKIEFRAALAEICIDDISAVLRTTDLRFQLTFVICAGLMHLILGILKFLEQTQE